MTSFALFLLLLLSYTLSASSNSNDEFLQCLSHVSPKVLYTPKNSSYTSVLDYYVNNLRFTKPSTPKPLVIVTPTHESEIQTVVYCAKKYDIQIRTRGGGHDYEGLSYVSHVPFVLLDMNKLRSINVDPKTATAWVQAGATLGELYYKISEKTGNRYAFPGGIWYTVGVSGLVSGGGYGVLRRKYGLAADNVLDARIIDVNGRVLDKKAMGEELFWAIRGGGASSFGVILSWKLKLVPVPKTVTAFQVDKTLEQNGTDILHKWQTVAPKLTKNIEIRVLADPIRINGPNDVSKTVLDGDSSTNASGKTLRLRFVGLFLGRQERLLSLMRKKLPELGMVKGETREVSFLQAVQLFSLFQAEDSPTVLLNRTSYRIPFKAKSDYVDKPISKEGLNGIWKMLLEYEPDKTNFIFTSYGGRMAEISESAIPFPHRAGTLYKMYMRVETYGDSNAMDWIRRLYKYLTPYVTKNPRTAYVNYNDLDLGVNNLKGPISYKQASIWGKRYFKNNFDRLVIVKSMVDPDNFFRHEQSIPPFSY